MDYQSNDPNGMSIPTDTPADAAPGPQGRSYDRHQRGEVNRETNHPVITAVVDPVFGSPKALSMATLDDVVTVAGVGPMTYRSAIETGFVSAPSAPNAPPPPSVPNRREPQEPQEPHPDLVVEPMDDDTEAALAGITSATDATSQVRAVQEAASGAEDFSDDTVNAVASQLNLEPALVREKAQVIRAGFARQAMAAVADELGPMFDDESFREFVWQDGQKKAMGAAIEQQAMRGSTAGYRALAQEYAAQLDVMAPDALTAARFGDGLSVKIGSDGRAVVYKDGAAWVTWEQAVKSGLIRVSNAT